MLPSTILVIHPWELFVSGIRYTFPSARIVTSLDSEFLRPSPTNHHANHYENLTANNPSNRTTDFADLADLVIGGVGEPTVGPTTGNATIAIVDTNSPALCQVANTFPTIAVVTCGLPTNLPPTVRSVIPISITTGELKQVVHNVASNRRDFNTTIAQALAEANSRLSMLGRIAADISASDIAVLRQLARGHSLKEISAHLNLAYGSIRNRVSTLCEKLNCRNTTELAILAYRLFGDKD